MSLIRTFIAIKIPLEKELREIYNTFREAMLDKEVRFIDDNWLHLTLMFIGIIDGGLLDDIGSRILIGIKNNNPFCISFSHFGYFNQNKNRRVIWIGVEPNVKLRILRNDIVEHVSEIVNFNKDGLFKPHVTLAKIFNWSSESNQAFRKLIDLDFCIKHPIMEVSLMKSELTNKRDLYTVLQTFNL